jgi:hypothetical protein
LRMLLAWKEQRLPRHWDCCSKLQAASPFRAQPFFPELP